MLPKDALIVVDYAATSLAVLKDWFGYLAAARNEPEGCRLRILLLERHADPEGGRCRPTGRESKDKAGPADLIGQGALFALPPLEATRDRRALLAETMRKAAPLLDPPAAPQSPPAPGADTWFDAQLADDRIDNEPLYLMMAGIYAARHGAVAAFALSRLALADQMAKVEAARLEKPPASGFADGGELLKHLAACVTLQNGCPPTALPALVEEEMALLRLRAPFSVQIVAERLCDCLPLLNNAVEPVRPDLIGEAFLLPVVAGGRFRDEATRRAIVLGAYRRAPAGTVDALIRCARDFAEGNANHSAVQWLHAVVKASTEFDELVRIADSLH